MTEGMLMQKIDREKLMVTSLQNPMSVKSKMECISSSSAAYCGPTSGHQELARQKEKLKEKLEHCRCHLIKV